MRTEIVRTEELTPRQQELLFGWDPDPFRSKGRELTWKPKDFHVVLLVDGQPASHVGLVKETVAVANQHMTVAGVGDVITVSSYQGRGLAQACLAEAQQFAARDWGIEHGMLFAYPELARLYRKLEWTVWEHPVWVDQPGGRIVIPRTTMVNSWNETRLPEGEINVKGLPW